MVANEHRPRPTAAVDRDLCPLEPTGTELQHLLSVAISYVSSVVDTLPAAVADLLAGVLNRYTGQAHPAPGLVALESEVLRWMANLFALPDEAMGVLTSGASLATFSALVTARVARLDTNFLDGTLYVTAQTHHAAAKAARLAGFPPAAVREVPVDDGFRIRHWCSDRAGRQVVASGAQR